MVCAIYNKIGCNAKFAITNIIFNFRGNHHHIQFVYFFFNFLILIINYTIEFKNDEKMSILKKGVLWNKGIFISLIKIEHNGIQFEIVTSLMNESF